MASHFDNWRGPKSSRHMGRRRRAQGRWAHTYAAVDLGTNNCRLLVARPTREGFRVIDSFSRIVRLGEGLGLSGRLAEEAMERTIGALRICASKMRRRGVTISRSIATQACREAQNCEEFFSRVASETGIELDIIEPAEEARLAVAGCAPLLDRECENGLVFDIGGGSTEVMWLRMCRDTEPELLAWTSLPCGVVTLAEAYGGRDVPAETYKEMVDSISEMLSPFEAAHRLRGAITTGGAQMLGTSGTVTTLAAIKLGLKRYERQRVDGSWLAAKDIGAISQVLATMTYEDRARHPCIGEGRADLVIAGCAIFDAIFDTWPAPWVRVADRGVRDGMLFHLMKAADAAAPRRTH